ncbi:MAG TPA: ADP-ribosylglycohydrolase family protein [Fimbriimonadales bacterium]|nr:ADP-ribosylglycohydrolase family protein [Fimbriimonadales bacterium]
MKHLWLSITQQDLEIEKLQAEQEGKDISSLLPMFEQLSKTDLENPRNQAEARTLLEEVQRLPLKENFPYIEPSELNAIREERPSPSKSNFSISGDLYDKIYGAWLGRCAGNLLGKPVEGWKRERMWGYLRETNRFPLSGYFSRSAANEILKRYEISPGFFIEDISHVPEDDDLNYTVIALGILEKHGRAFTPSDVGDYWLSHLPILHTCTAERVAYKNIVNGLHPPETASYCNPYREWIGAQIRADMWGYVNPANPEAAASMAWRDACISHVKNGIYGAMWVAAMLSVAFCTQNIREIIEAGLKEIPQKSRLTERIREQIARRESFSSVDDAIGALHRDWDEMRAHDWCHVISNAEIVATALLWGDGDFARSICLAVQACFDTDCNGATVGSIIGAMKGTSALPNEWVSPLQETLETGVHGFMRVPIRELALRTMRLIEA